MYQIKELLKYKDLQHATSTLEDGNMSFKFDDEKTVFNNRKKFFKKIKINSKDVIDMGPVVDKANKVVFVKKKDGLNSLDQKIEPVWGDALITNRKKYYLAMSFADCFGIIFYTPKKNVLALAHAGYVPISAGIIARTLSKLKKDFKINAEDLFCVVTPGAQDCCLKYKKVFKSVLQTKKATEHIYRRQGYYHLDLLKWILDDLKDGGINEVVISNFCSACGNKNVFYSKEKQNKGLQKKGRNMLIVGMR